MSVLDYVFPRSANEIIKSKIKQVGGQIAGEEYVLLGEDKFETLVTKIIAAKPDVIFNTINGDSNIAFFNELRKQGITPSIIPTISFSIAEDEIQYLGGDIMAGDYAVWNYFQSINSIENFEYVNNFKKKYGSDRVTDDPMEAGYIGVYLYAKAVDIAGTTSLPEVKKSLKGLTFSAPEGIVGIDPDNQHLAKIVRVGQILPNGQFKIVFSTEEHVDPIPYPEYKSKEMWDAFLSNLYSKWNQNWANPRIEVSAT
ncbi:MAG: transporter substrate-binding protein [Nanoarchaeota archaeon]|nr:transporter substrate-binding protein [Nanoarchaeota archaeon]